MGIMNQIRSNGEDLTDQKIVEKFLRSLPTKFDVIVVAIENSKYLTQLCVNELMGSLQFHEQRINRSVEKSLEKAFQAKANICRDKFNNSSHEEVLSTH